MVTCTFTVGLLFANKQKEEEKEQVHHAVVRLITIKLLHPSTATQFRPNPEGRDPHLRNNNIKPCSTHWPDEDSVGLCVLCVYVHTTFVLSKFSPTNKGNIPLCGIK